MFLFFCRIAFVTFETEESMNKALQAKEEQLFYDGRLVIWAKRRMHHVELKFFLVLISGIFYEYVWAGTWENRIFAYAKTKTQISFAVTAKLISAFVFATRIVQSLSFLNTKFQASSHFLRLRSLICVGPGRKPRRPVFWRRGSFYFL